MRKKNLNRKLNNEFKIIWQNVNLWYNNLGDEMKKIVFDFNPLGNFSLSAEVYYEYYKEKYGREIYFYTRENGIYKKVIDISKLKNSQNRVITFVDLGDEVKKIPFDKDIRVKIIDESYEEDELLIEIVKKLGSLASWKNSKIRVLELAE